MDTKAIIPVPPPKGVDIACGGSKVGKVVGVGDRADVNSGEEVGLGVVVDNGIGDEVKVGVRVSEGDGV
jgi:hypothetical protein